MRTFEAADTAALPPVSIRAEDGRAIDGTWRYVGTHGLLFTPAAPFPGSTRFQVTVGAKARSLAGDTLSSDYTFSFFTEPPQVTSTLPREGARDLRRDSSFRLVFNQRVDPDAVARKARLWVKAKAGDTPKSVALRSGRPTKNVVGEAKTNLEHIVELTPN
jgi:hypothetical protein